jgi:uncharacterized membrane protein
MQAAEPAQEPTSTPPKSLAGALAYFTFVPALVFLFVERYRRNSFVRFHSLQCLFVWAAAALLALVFWFSSSTFFMIPVIGPLIATLVPVLAGLAAILLWIVLLIKAYQGERFKLPLVGDVAERYSVTAYTQGPGSPN